MSKGLTLATITMRIMGVDGYNPITSESSQWINWVTNFGLGTCRYCAEQNGKIYKYDSPPEHIPVHDRCNCYIEPVVTIMIGTATIDGSFGADKWLYLYKTLPGNYISKENAKKKGWNNLMGNLRKVVPGATIGGNVYYDYGNKLPQKPGRVWHEADINYTGGYRNQHRIIYSNDGLMFVTYDHYETFYELV